MKPIVCGTSRWRQLTFHLANTIISTLHEQTFLRGMPWLCKYMPKPTNARHLIPDPENEPNFYNLSKLFPLAGDEQEIVVPTGPTSTKMSPTLQPIPATPVATAVAHAGFPRGLIPTQAFGLATADRLLPHHASLLTQPHLTSTLLHRQHILNQAAAALEGQAKSENNALLNAALSGNLGLNGGNFLRGFPF